MTCQDAPGASFPYLPQSLVHGLTGLAPGTIEPVADAMASALKASSGNLEEMGRAGGSRVARQHDVVASSEKLVALFHRASLEHGSSEVSGSHAVRLSSSVASEPARSSY